MTAFTLTSQQSEALELMIDFVRGEDPNERMFLLEGYAGTGKTSIFWKFYESLINDVGEYLVAVTAPTNKRMFEKLWRVKLYAKRLSMMRIMAR